MTREEAVVAIGLDTTKIRQQTNQFSTDFKSTLKKLGGEFAGALTGGAIVAGINGILQKMDELKDRAENLGVDTDFLQGMGHIAAQDAVGGIKTFEKAISELSVKLGQAKEGEQAQIATFEKYGITLAQIERLDAAGMFYAISDKIASIEDPSIRTAAAFDLLGKSGRNMAGILGQGSEKLNAMVDSVRKVSQEEIESLAAAKAQIDESLNDTTTFFGKLLAAYAGIYKNFGVYLMGGWEGIAEHWVLPEAERQAQTDWAQREIQIAEKESQRAKRAASERSSEESDLAEAERMDSKFKLEAAKWQEEVEKKNHKAKIERQKAELEYTKENFKWQEQIGSAMERYANAAKTEFLPTLDELAASGIYTQQAQRLQWLAQDTKDAFLWGDKKGVAANIKETQSIRAELSKAGVYEDPMQGVIDELEVLTDPLRNGKGLPIEARMTE